MPKIQALRRRARQSFCRSNTLLPVGIEDMEISEYQGTNTLDRNATCGRKWGKTSSNHERTGDVQPDSTHAHQAEEASSTDCKVDQQNLELTVRFKSDRARCLSEAELGTIQSSSRAVYISVFCCSLFPSPSNFYVRISSYVFSVLGRSCKGEQHPRKCSFRLLKSKLKLIFIFKFSISIVRARQICSIQTR